MSKHVIATIIHGQGGVVTTLLPGEISSQEYARLLDEGKDISELTEDHITELIAINRAYYQNQLQEAILQSKAVLIPPLSCLDHEA